MTDKKHRSANLAPARLLFVSSLSLANIFFSPVSAYSQSPPASQLDSQTEGLLCDRHIARPAVTAVSPDAALTAPPATESPIAESPVLQMETISGRHSAQSELEIRERLRQDPNSAGDWYRLGNRLMERGQSEAAIAAYQTAIQLNPDYAAAYQNLGNLLLAQNRYTAAETA